MLVLPEEMPRGRVVPHRQYMKFLILQLSVFAVLIGLQGVTGWLHFVWQATYYAAVAWIWIVLLSYAVVFFFINRPEVQKRFHGDPGKWPYAKQFGQFLREWCFAAIWLLVLSSPYMALGQLLIAAFNRAVTASIFDRRNGY